MERGAGAAAHTACISAAGCGFYFGNFFGIFCERYRLPGDGAVHPEHHPAASTPAYKIFASARDRFEYRKRGHYYRKPAEHTDRIVFWEFVSSFMWHLGPVALIGLFLDWVIIHFVFRRKYEIAPIAQKQIPLPALEFSRLTKPGLVVLGVVIGFFAGAPPAMVAALGAAVMLITRTLDPRKIYQQVDWGLLVLLVGLFLIVGGAENAGIVGKLLVVAGHWDLQHIAVFAVTTAVLSNLVSNVPAVMLLKSVVSGLANQHTAWLTHAMASTLAGNLTITGSVANIIVVESARPEVEIGFREYFRAGLPITLATMIVGWAWLSWV